MYAGKTNIKVGTKVKIKNITDEFSSVLNGLTGVVTHPFPYNQEGDDWVGIYLDNILVRNINNAIFISDRVNVRVNKIEIIDDEIPYGLTFYENFNDLFDSIYTNPNLSHFCVINSNKVLFFSIQNSKEAYGFVQENYPKNLQYASLKHSSDNLRFRNFLKNFKKDLWYMTADFIYENYINV